MTQAEQVIRHRLRKIAPLTILTHARSTMSLRQRRTIISDDQRDVGVAVRCLRCDAEVSDLEAHGFSRFLELHNHTEDEQSPRPAIPYPRSTTLANGQVLILPLHPLTAADG